MKLKLKKHNGYVCTYEVEGQELANTGKFELDIKIGTDIIWQNFIIADIQKKEFLGLITGVMFNVSRIVNAF